MESKGMKFARQMMEKMGWKEGNGLGVNQHGITEALKPAGKFNVSGLGHKEFNDFQWWDHAFNKAAQAFEVKVTNDQGAVVEKVNTVGKITTKKSSSSATSDNLSYGSFKKIGTLSNGIEKTTNFTPATVEEDFSVKLSDEDLFRVCGGLTAHKGARHGLTASGKLARIAQQEAELLEKLQNSEKKAGSKKEKKKDKVAVNSSINVSAETTESDTQKDSEETLLNKRSTKEKRKRKRDQENVLFPEDVGNSLSQIHTGTPEITGMAEQSSEEIVKKKKKKKSKCDDNLHTEEILKNSCEVANGETLAPIDTATKKKKNKSKDKAKSRSNE